nr:MAG TPA_asm: hypothetical protein [Caudoviricetes sp.]
MDMASQRGCIYRFALNLAQVIENMGVSRLLI